MFRCRVMSGIGDIIYGLDMGFVTLRAAGFGQSSLSFSFLVTFFNGVRFAVGTYVNTI